MVCRFFCLVHATTIHFELCFATGMTEINEEAEGRLAYYGILRGILILASCRKVLLLGLAYLTG